MSEHKTPPLRPGCYLIWFKPTQTSSGIPSACIGTFRVTEQAGGDLRASSDLYTVPDKDLDSKIAECMPTGRKSPSMPHARRGEIPIFHRENYLYYLEVLSIKGIPTRVRLNFRGHRYESLSSRTLVPGGNFQLELTGTPKTNENRSEKVYPDKLTGELFNGTENGSRGELVLQYIGKDLRRAHLRIIRIQSKSDEEIRVPGESLPRGVSGWKELFQKKIGWQLDVSEPPGSPFVQTAPEKGWAPYDLGLAATDVRERLPITTEDDWVYDLLCVPKFAQSRFLGMMFDAEATDLNNSPRESAAVAALETVTLGEINEVAITGIAQEMFDGRLYYRTALHEVGHAMNLTHTLTDNCLMNTTDFLLPTQGSLAPESRKNASIARKAFNHAFNPDFAFSPKDCEWLQHAPDIAVRPGGISRNAVGWVCEFKKDINVVSLRNESQAELIVDPVLRKVPYGAPVRLNYTLANNGPTLRVPSDLSLTEGVLSGRVFGPDRQERYFRSLFRCCDSNTHGGHLEELTAGKSKTNAVTLLRGTDGPLFPLAGTYNIRLELRWDESGRTNRVVGRTSITVSEASDPDHGRSAETALNEPKLMLPIVQGLLEEDSLQALSKALNSPILAPHYVAIALNCYHHGKARRYHWDKLLQPPPPLPLGLAGRAIAGNGQSVGSTRALKTLAPPPLTEVERKGLEKMFPPKPKSPSEQKSRSKLERPSKVGVRSNHVVDHSLRDVTGWLDKVMQVAQPLTAAATREEIIRQLLGGVGAVVSGGLMVQMSGEKRPSKAGARNINPNDLKKQNK